MHNSYVKRNNRWQSKRSKNITSNLLNGIENGLIGASYTHTPTQPTQPTSPTTPLNPRPPSSGIYIFQCVQLSVFVGVWGGAFEKRLGMPTVMTWQKSLIFCSKFSTDFVLFFLQINIANLTSKYMGHFFLIFPHFLSLRLSVSSSRKITTFYGERLEC